MRIHHPHHSALHPVGHHRDRKVLRPSHLRNRHYSWFLEAQCVLERVRLCHSENNVMEDTLNMTHAEWSSRSLQEGSAFNAAQDVAKMKAQAVGMTQCMTHSIG
jgi:hypothetical protein